MSNLMKKRRLEDHVQNNDDNLVTFDALSTDELVLIFEYLSPEKIMLARLNKKMRDAATKTVVPINSDIDDAFSVYDVKKYNAMAAMTTALPNLQQIKIGKNLGIVRDYNPTYKFNDGEDPYNRIAFRTANLITHDIGILSNFTRLRELKIEGEAPLNGRYPMLFNFPLLQKLHIHNMHYLKMGLEMLAGLPYLEELICVNCSMAGNIRSLGVLKGTLTKVVITRMLHYADSNVKGDIMDLADFPKLQHVTLALSRLTGDLNEMKKGAFLALETLELTNRRSNIQGNFMNLSHLPHLKALNIRYTNVTGEIREISSSDFPSLESLVLPPSVYGGCGYKFQRISDAPDIIAAVSTFMKKRPNLQLEDWYAELSEDSPDFYHSLRPEPDPPFKIEIVKAGSRLGWRWSDLDVYGVEVMSCEINWLDPEPDKESVHNIHYGQYIQELEEIEKTLDAYRGLYQPPTAEEFRRIHSKYVLGARQI